MIDLGDNHIGGDGPQTWGVLVTYQGEDWVFRYEGGGQLTLTISNYGAASLTSNGSLREVSLPAISGAED